LPVPSRQSSTTTLSGQDISCGKLRSEFFNTLSQKRTFSAPFTVDRSLATVCRSVRTIRCVSSRHKNFRSDSVKIVTIPVAIAKSCIEYLCAHQSAVGKR
jgi:hypothetical protein